MGLLSMFKSRSYKMVQHIVIDWNMQINELFVFLTLSWPPAKHISNDIQYRNKLFSALIFTAIYKCHNNKKFIDLLIANLKDDEVADVYQGSVLSGVAELNNLLSTIINDTTSENIERTKEVMKRFDCSLEDAVLWRIYRTLMMALSDVQDVDAAADMIRNRFVYPLSQIPFDWE